MGIVERDVKKKKNKEIYTYRLRYNSITSQDLSVDFKIFYHVLDKSVKQLEHVRNTFKLLLEEQNRQKKRKKQLEEDKDE